MCVNTFIDPELDQMIFNHKFKSECVRIAHFIVVWNALKNVYSDSSIEAF